MKPEPEPEVIGKCAWTDETICEGDDYVTLHDGDIVTQAAFDKDGCEAYYASRKTDYFAKEDCHYYEYAAAWYTDDYWSEVSVECTDGDTYHEADVTSLDVYGGDTVYIAPNDEYPDDLYTCDNCGILAWSRDVCHHDDYNYCPDCEPETPNLRDYSDSPLDYFAAQDDDGPIDGFAFRKSKLPLMGVELELEADNPDSVKGFVEATEFAIVKSDSSLDEEYGAEVCSVPATIGAHRRVWPDLVQKLQRKYGARSFHNTDNRCGIHIHINGRAFTNDLHTARFCYLIGAPENEKLSTLIAQRSSSYAKIRDKSYKVDHYRTPVDLWCRRYGEGRYETAQTAEAEFLYLRAGDMLCNDPMSEKASVLGYLESDHYDAASPTSKGTIEVRIYKGTLHRYGVLRALEHTLSCWEYTKGCGLGNATADKYLSWLAGQRKTYPKLCAWLWEKCPEFRQACKRFSSGYVRAMVTTDVAEREG